MKCPICQSAMEFSFQKRFEVFDLGNVDYEACDGCGFTLSRTHASMPEDEWRDLNERYHRGYQGMAHNPDDPRWIDRLRVQAYVIRDLAELGLLDRQAPWLDYACGDGKLADLARKDGLELAKFEPYMSGDQGYLPSSALVAKHFGFVLSTSVIEHLRTRDELDRINALVSDDGVLGLHTVVCERIPRDPGWFYLLPVHCAFHTNRSMEALFRQWGYTTSLYNVEARLWLWFRSRPSEVELRSSIANLRPAGPHYVFKQGFVDYWK